MRIHLLLASLLTAGVSAMSTASLAQLNPDAVENIGSVANSKASADSSAKALSNPLAAPNASNAKAEGPSKFTAGGVPGSDKSATGSGVAPQAYGSFGIPYTSKRVIHGGNFLQVLATPDLLSKTYPYRAVGKLTFKTYQGVSSYCTASLIRTGVIVTAAHCVSAFGDPRLFTNFRFTPGTFAELGILKPILAPYGVWQVRSIVRPASWVNGTDPGTGAARDNDLAVLVIGKNLLNLTVGQYTGYLGYGWNSTGFVSSPKTGSLLTAAVTTLGYPALLDAGRVMQRSDGPTYPTTVGGALQYWQGSNFTAGADGGPWVVNFGAANPTYSGGAGPGIAPAQMVVGVTSWRSADPNASKDNYASRFGQNSRYPAANYGGRGAGNIGSLLNTLCNGIVPGTAQTWAQQGFCS